MAEQNSNIELNLQLMVDLGAAKFEYIFGAIENIESKSGVLVGFMGVIGTLVATTYQDMPRGVYCLNILAGITFLFSMACLLWALLGTSYRIDPEIVSFTEKYVSKDAYDFKLQLIANIGESVKQNLEKLNNKTRGFNYGLTALGLSIFFLILGNIEFLKIICGE